TGDTIDFARGKMVNPARQQNAIAIGEKLAAYRTVWMRIVELKQEQRTLTEKALVPGIDKLRIDSQFVANRIAALGRDDLVPVTAKV
ncbi:hypothetical protein J8J27_30250, partial [Mycobacterium tuberculosis]|nr:hypothetical protein [Mycobacterium tuberculosis]